MMAIDVDARADAAAAAMVAALEATCPQLQDELARNVPPGLRRPCEHPSCAPYRDSAKALSKARQILNHVPGMIDLLEKYRSNAVRALQAFEPGGDADAIAYLRSSDSTATVPVAVIDWAREQGIDATKRLRCPLPLGGHDWGFFAVPSLPAIDELIRLSRDALPRLEQRFLAAIDAAEALAR